MFQLNFSASDATTGPTDTDLGSLPEWDLSDLYTDPDAPALKSDLAWLEKECQSFAADYEGKLAALGAEALLTCVQRQEKINAISGRIMSYAGLRYYQLTTDGERTKFMSDLQVKITDFSTPLVFFTLELNRLDDEHLDSLLAQNADLARYRRVFERIRAMKPYQLSDELEKFLHDLGAVGDAWEKLFDETTAGLEFTIDGTSYNIEGALNFLTDHDRAKREAAARELAAVFQANLKVYSRLHNTLAKEKDIIDRWRAMPSPQTGRHLSNDVEPEVVEAAMRLWQPIQNSATAIMSSSANGLGWINCRFGTAMLRCRWKATVLSAGMKPAVP